MSIPSDPKPRLRNPRRLVLGPEHPRIRPDFVELYTRNPRGSGSNSSLFFCTCSNMNVFLKGDTKPGSKTCSGCNSGLTHFEARFGTGWGRFLTPQNVGARSATCLKFTSDFWPKTPSKPRSELASFWCFRRGRFDQKDAHSGYLGISVRGPESALSRVQG